MNWMRDFYDLVKITRRIGLFYQNAQAKSLMHQKPRL